MKLEKLFEIHSEKMRPSEPFSESENPEQWARIVTWQEMYIQWLEDKYASLKFLR